MTKITKHLLEVENEIEYDLIGICSHVGDYKLVWNINQTLNINLAKETKYFEVNHKKNTASSKHPYYFMEHEDEKWSIYLIKNKFEGKYLIPEKQQIDFFLFICNNFSIDLGEWIDKLRNTASVIAAYSFDPQKIASTELIEFE